MSVLICGVNLLSHQQIFQVISPCHDLCQQITVAAKKNATLKYVIFDPENLESFVAKIFSITRSLSVT